MAKVSAYFTIAHFSDKQDQAVIKKGLDTFAGVNSVSTNKEQHCVVVDYDSSGVSQKKLSARLEELGYPVKAERQELHVM